MFESTAHLLQRQGGNMLKAIKMHLQRPQKTFLVKNYTILLERSTIYYRLYI